MSTLFLTSNLETYRKNEIGAKNAIALVNKNAIVDNFKQSLKAQDNFLFVASSIGHRSMTEEYFNIVKQSFEQTIPFKNYTILDETEASRAEELVINADFILLSGGHVPSQNRLFQLLDLKHLLAKNNRAVICGVSAGSMNCAETVYCPPEYEEELTPTFIKYFPGLALSKISIYPHWEEHNKENELLSTTNIFHEIMLPDSEKAPFLAFDDGTYILQKGDAGKATVFGQSFLFCNGCYEEFSKIGEVKEFDWMEVINKKKE